MAKTKDEQPKKKYDGASPLETRVIISETGAGKCVVQWACYVKDSDIVVPIRAAHLVGHLIVAAFYVLLRSFGKDIESK